MTRRLVATIAIVTLIVAACSSTDDSAGDTAIVTEAEPTPPPEPTETAADDTAAEETEAAPEPDAEDTEGDGTEAEPEPEAEDAAVFECSAPVGVTETSLTLAGDTHDVRLFVPEVAATATGPLPTVLNWHGLGSNGNEQAAYSAYEGLAETEGFVVVHPTGTANSWELVEDLDPDRSDLAFADALIDELIAEWCADQSRIYSTGMSNGGFFTARLICEIGDRIAAAVSVAATYHLPECEPARAVPYIAFHGTEDGVVPFDGSGESSLADDSDPQLVELFGQVMPAEFAEFAADAACDPDPQVVDVSPEVIRYDYTGCVDDTPMSFYEIVGGGHQWPGSPLGPALEGALGFNTDDVSATIDGWAFLSQHTL